MTTRTELSDQATPVHALKEAPPGTSTPFWGRKHYHFAIVLILVFSGALYSGALTGTTVWEDDELIQSGRTTLAETFTSPFLRAYFRPIVSLSFWLDHRLWNEEPFMYHQTNLLIHVVTTLAVILLVRRAFRSRLAALMAGLFFAVQPAQVSTTAWIGGRTDSLCTLFVALFALLLIRGVQEGCKPFTVIASSVVFFLAALTKEQSLALLPLVPLGYWTFSNPESARSWRTAFQVSVPFLAFSAVFLLMAYSLGPGLPTTASHGLMYRAVLCGQSITYYALLLIAPAGSWMHWTTAMNIEPYGIFGVLSGYSILALSIWLSVWFYRRVPAVCWFIAFVLLALAPVINMIPVGSLIVAPFRAGLAGLGISALLGWFCAVGSKRLFAMQGHVSAQTRSRRAERLIAIAACVYMAWCAHLTVWGVAQWRDEETVFKTFARFDPWSYYVRKGRHKAHTKAGQGELAQKNVEEYLSLVFASDAWRTPISASNAIEKDPQVIARTHRTNGDKRPPKAALAEMFVMLGYAKLLDEDRAGAEIAFRTGEAIDRENPNVKMAIGRWFTDGKQWAKAIPYLIEVIEYNPRIYLAQLLLGRSLVEVGRIEEGIGAFRLAVSLQPWDPNPYLSLAAAQVGAGKKHDAIKTLESALVLTSGREKELELKLATLIRETREKAQVPPRVN